MQTLFFESVMMGVVGFVFSALLMGPGMIFYPYWRLLDWLALRGLEWLAKPLGYCALCFSGQLALWHYLLTYSWWGVPVLHGAFFVCLSILTTQILLIYAQRD